MRSGEFVSVKKDGVVKNPFYWVVAVFQTFQYTTCIILILKNHTALPNFMGLVKLLT